MSDDAWKEPVNYDHVVSLRALEVLLNDYELPDIYNQILVKPWMDIANTLLELNGELSEPWARMLWFSRAVCEAVSMSLTTRGPEPLEQALLTFMFWLRVCNQETGSLDLELVVAKNLCRRMKMQMMVDLGRSDFSKVINAAPAPAPGASEEATFQSQRELLHKSGIHLKPDHQSVSETQPKNEDRTTPENPENILAVMATAPEYAMTQNLTEGSNSQDLLVLTKVQESLSQLKLQPTIGHDKLNQNNLNTEITITSSGETIMDISTVSESIPPPVDNISEVTLAADTTHLTGRSVAEWTKSMLVPIGVWLAFHDEDVSTMIKLAVYDRSNDNYIFSNKHGFLVRQLTTPDLLHLIENELVDIIERRLIPRKPTA